MHIAYFNGVCGIRHGFKSIFVRSVVANRYYKVRIHFGQPSAGRFTFNDFQILDFYYHVTLQDL